MKRFLLIVWLVLLGLPVGELLAAHGISLDGDLKYPADFQGFSYTSAEAKVGGTLTLHSEGSFDKMNPFTLKGTAPEMLSELIFETLVTHSMDEPFAEYGLVAKDIAQADDGMAVTFTLHPEARFADGSPITTEDVVFSLEILKSDQAHPFYQSYWKDILRAEILDPHKIRFHFAQKNRELALIAGDLPILNRKFYQAHPFDKETLESPVGSGPYRIESFDPGKIITYRRNPDYWGWKLPVRRGTYNFDRIVIKYFKDPVVALEGFKAGEFDYIHVSNSKDWARDYQGEKFTSGKIVKETLPHRNGTGMQGFVFNLRRPMFQDIRVRQALILAFDFEWSNQNLFYGQYVRANSYFSNSELAAEGAPSPEEIQLLEPFLDKLPSQLFGPILPPPSSDPPGSIRENLRQAAALLKESGWSLNGAKQLANKEEKPLQIEMLLASPAFERVLTPYADNLKKLGITLNYRTVDSALYQQRVHDFDFDMLVHVFGQSQSPGNEQRNMWHSENAQIKGSQNLIGLAHPAVDAMVDKIIYATNRRELVTATHALDRVLLAGRYLVPNWHIPYHRHAYWSKFDRPKQTPLYYQPEGWLMTWWIKE